MRWTITEYVLVAWRILSQRYGLKKFTWAAIAIVMFVPEVGQTQTLPEVAGPTLSLRELVDGYKRDQSAILYSQCFVEEGKALIVISLKSNDIWYYEFKKGWYVNSAHIVMKGNGFDFSFGLGGIYSRERMRHIIEALLKTPFEFLMPGQLDKMLISKPSTGCPELDPTELYQSK